MKTKHGSQQIIVQHHYHWVDIIHLLLGTVLLTEFFTLFSQGFFSIIGFQHRITYLLKFNNTIIIHQSLQWFSSCAWIFAPLSEVMLAFLSLCMLLLLFRAIASWLVVGVFAIYYLAHFNVPGIWMFEYLMPLLIAICISLANLPRLKQPCFKDYFFGSRLFRTCKWPLHVVLIFAISVLAWYVLRLSLQATHINQETSIYAAITLCVLLLISLSFEKLRIKEIKNYGCGLITIPWMDIITLIIGAMLVFQVYEDFLLNWFTLTGYRNLTQVYQHYTSAPDWFAAIIHLSGKSAELFMPVQLVLESVCALALVLLILRLPFALFAFFLFGALTYIEFGVPATWPATPMSELTWTWELLFSTCIIFFIFLFNLQRTYSLSANQRFKLGTNVFNKSSFITRVIVAIIAGLLMAGSVLLSGTLKQYNHILAIESGLTLFLYLVFLGIIDFNRPRLE
jgi:hypothetical protein